MKQKKMALFQSVIALVLCFSMLVGTTFAWFTDGVSSGYNLIATGNLDIEMEYLDASGTWKKVTESTEVLDKDALWEPGYTEVAYLKLSNVGNLALKYALGIGILDETGSMNMAGQFFRLSDHIRFGVIESETPVAYTSRTAARQALSASKVINEGYSSTYNLYPEKDKDVRYATLVVYMPEEVGNVANYATGATKPEIKLGIQLMATQADYEKDSFGTGYDTAAEVPGFQFPDSTYSDKVSANVTTDDENKVSEEVTLTGANSNAVIPTGVQLEDGAEKVTLEVSSMDKSEANVSLGENEEMRSLNVHMTGVAEGNTQPMEITLREAAAKGLNSTSIKLYHVEDGVTEEMTLVDTFTAHNQFKYDPATGDITLYMATFSEVAVVADTENAWKGEFDYSWYSNSKAKTSDADYIIANADQLAAFGAIVGGMDGQTKDSFKDKTVKLITDVNLGDKESENKSDLIFYPIGYYNSTGSYKKDSGVSVTSSVSSFEGTFDGQGHTIANFYQNTWEMFGDYNDGYSGTPNHYKDAMGLFGYVYGGTVKNLTVDNFSSDGEFTPTGVIAAYADGNSIFENIAITNCNPRVYNTGNGGIIGIAGDTSAANDDHITLTNITVDNSNKITALWGSWDVACGGLVGMYRGNVDGSGNATGDTISFENCHVAAQIDVYNDVCANYQYYAYRYSGMIIGSVRHNTKNDDGKTIPNMTGISASDCTVNYGDWNDYYYCEMVKNSIASYTHDYQFSRLTKDEIKYENGKPVGCTHDHTTAGYEEKDIDGDGIVDSDVLKEDKIFVHLPFHQLFTGYSWGVSSIGLTELEGIKIEDQKLDIEEGDQQESVVKFEAKTETASYSSGTPVTISDLFKQADDLDTENYPIMNDKVQVFVSPVGEGSTAGGKYEADPNDWTKGTITFTGDGKAEVSITDYNFCKTAKCTVTVIGTKVFAHKFPHTDAYLYRVGNQNAISLSSLFTTESTVTGDVQVVIERVEATSDAMTFAVVAAAEEGSDFNYTPNSSAWEKGTIEFSKTFTGPVKVSIKDASSGFTPLYLEVINAKNVTKAESATANDVVLLNDISGTFVVSNGHTFHGNGFTVTLPTTSVQEVGQGFTGYISIGAAQDSGSANGGNLDNVRIEGPVYPEMYIYRDQAKITDKNDTDYGSGNNMRYFKNSVIVYGGNCTISNSYISGSRTALCLRGGNNVVIENTTLSGGAYANMQICAGSSVTLRDLTTVQVDKADSYGKGKTAHGLGIAVDSNVVDIYIEGNLNQRNWLNEAQWNEIVPSVYQSQFPKFFTESTFNKHWHYLEGNTSPYVNLAFIFACNWDTNKIHDNRETVDYAPTPATIAGVSGGVYSNATTGGNGSIEDGNLTTPEYKDPGFKPVAPILNFDNSENYDEDDANDANDTYCIYDESTGTLKIGVSGSSKTIDLSNITVVKNGSVLEHTASLNGTKISGNSVTIKAADGAKQTLTFKATSNDAGYDKYGNPIEGSIEYTWTVTVEIAVLSYPAPVWNMGGDYQFDKTNLYYAYYSTSQGYGEAVPIYEGIKINYYDKTGKFVELDLTGTKTHPTGSNNSNSNAFTYTLSDGSTLTMKYTSGFKTGATTHLFTTYKNKVYIYPQSLDNDNYVRAKTTNQDFDVKISYTFTDPNGQSISQAMRWYNAMADNKNVTTVQWKDFDGTNGKKPSTCVTPDTLITLADGSQARVDSLKGNEELLVWNHQTGKIDTAPVAYIVNHDAVVAEHEVINLIFSNGKNVKIIGEHVFFDATLNKYVALDANAENFIGHSFLAMNNDGTAVETAELVNVEKETYETSAYEVVSYKHLTCFTNDMLSTSAYLDQLLNVFDVDSDSFMYNHEDVLKDIETYGLYTYADFEGLISEEAFELYDAQYLKIAVGKGYITWDDILALIDIYFNVEVEPLQ